MNQYAKPPEHSATNYSTPVSSPSAARTTASPTGGMQLGHIQRYFPQAGEQAGAIQRKAAGGMPSAAPAAIGGINAPAPAAAPISPVLPTHSSAGAEPLPENTQAKMEQSFGADFSAVRVHPHSQESVAIGARAHTQGNAIHFAPGEYHPATAQGQELLGHELTHVIQQRQGRVPGTIQAKGLTFNEDTALEKEADRAGEKAARGEAVKAGSYTSLNMNTTNGVGVIQRQPQHKQTALSGKYNNTIDLTQPGFSSKKSRPSGISGNLDNQWVWTTPSQRNVSEVDLQGKPVSTKIYDPKQQKGVSTTTRDLAGEVEAIIDPDNCEGRSTAAEYDPLGWYWIKETKSVKSNNLKTPNTYKIKSWVRFHLLNAKLGGDGHNPAHLVPTAKLTNSCTEWQANFEEKAKNLVEQNIPIHYYVKVDFLSTPNQQPAQPGDQYFQFFPSQIYAEYTPLKGSNKQTKSVTLSVPGGTGADKICPPDRSKGNNTYILTQCTKRILEEKLGLSESFSTWLESNKSKLSQANTVNFQALYNAWVEKYLDDTNLSVNTFNKEWSTLEDLFVATSGDMFRLTASQNAFTGQVILSKDLSNEKIKNKYSIDELHAMKLLDSDKAIWTAIKKLANTSTKLTPQTIYDMLIPKQANMVKDYDNDWSDYLTRLTNLPGSFINLGKNYKLELTYNNPPPKLEKNKIYLYYVTNSLNHQKLIKYQAINPDRCNSGVCDIRFDEKEKKTKTDIESILSSSSQTLSAEQEAFIFNKLNELEIGEEKSNSNTSPKYSRFEVETVEMALKKNEKLLKYLEQEIEKLLKDFSAAVPDKNSDNTLINQDNQQKSLRKSIMQPADSKKENALARITGLSQSIDTSIGTWIGSLQNKLKSAKIKLPVLKTQLGYGQPVTQATNNVLQTTSSIASPNTKSIKDYKKELDKIGINEINQSLRRFNKKIKLLSGLFSELGDKNNRLKFYNDEENKKLINIFLQENVDTIDGALYGQLAKNEEIEKFITKLRESESFKKALKNATASINSNKQPSLPVQNISNPLPPSNAISDQKDLGFSMPSFNEFRKEESSKKRSANEASLESQNSAQVKRANTGEVDIYDSFQIKLKNKLYNFEFRTLFKNKTKMELTDEKSDELISFVMQQEREKKKLSKDNLEGRLNGYGPDLLKRICDEKI